MFNYYDKFTNNFKKVIQRAAWLCLKDVNKIITADHLLLAILTAPESLACEMLKKTGVIKSKQIKTVQSKALNLKIDKIDYNRVFNLSMDKESIEILKKAAELAIKQNKPSVGTEHLLYAMTKLRSKPLLRVLDKTSIKITDLEKELSKLLFKKSDIKTTKIATKTYRQKNLFKERFLSTPALDHFTIDLTNKQKELVPLIGREKEMDRLINILSRKHKNNPLLLGEPGVGKTAIVEGLAQKIYCGKVPDILINKRILSLDLNAVVAGSIYRGEFENRLKQIIEEIKSQDDIILFIDEIHNLIGAGSASGSLDAANILKPHLTRGDFSCIGATTLTEYKTYFENDTTLERRFQPIIIEEPSVQETVEVLKGIRAKMEEYHRITITDQAIEEAVHLSERFMPNKFFPDKAIDLIDEAASSAKVKNIKDIYGKKIKNFKHKLKNLFLIKEKAVSREDFSRASELKAAERKLLSKLDYFAKRQKKAMQTKIGIIGKENIAQIVTEIVKIPFLEMANINKSKLLQLEKLLAQKIIGQDDVLKEIAGTLRRSEAGLANPKRPLASFIFLGPSGVGKTETAKAIASEIFGDNKALITINMSEFQESFNISKLIGAPAGYVGYKQGNQLADKINAKPYSVVLFDEMEKAHPDVFNLLLSVLEEGYLTDAAGKHINFKNTVIIFTSNVGLERFNQAQSLGFAARSQNQKEQFQEQFERTKNKILEELQNHLRIEFLNRIDKILVFKPLTHEAVSKIVELNIKELNKKLADKNMALNLSPTAKSWLARESFSPDDGARSVRRIIQEEIEELLVEKILKGDINNGDKVKVKMRGKHIVIDAGK
ncbi:MAG: ATP-dependent Clp protease ATP-binding subunit [Candidatus Jacksonbacteria bacterium]